MPWQEIRHLKAAKAARDQELAEAQKQLEAERFQVEELERNLLSQVGPAVTWRIDGHVRDVGLRSRCQP